MATTKAVPLSLEQLADVVNKRDREYVVVLAEPQKWIDWESALTLMARDIYIVAVAPGEDFPLFVSFSRDGAEAQTMPFNDEMRFIFKSAPASGED